ncbi:MAG: carboxylesterase [Silicimonas sp.]|nr:carboxylesterase [Silicimonas sp.]
MGLIGDIFGIIFGGGRNAIRETAEVFRPNAENEAARLAAHEAAALAQFASEFALPRQGWFDSFMNGLNRLPRPMLALGTLGLFASAMADPVWFAQRMQGIALVPEPLWWLMGAIVSFYFGARHQTKTHEFQRTLAETLSLAPGITRKIRDLGQLDDDLDDAADEPLVLSQPDRGVASNNAALDEWRALR